MEFILHISVFSNLIMIGVSLITHYVTYPSFALIHEKLFNQFHNQYSNIMLIIVGPVMIVEFISTLILSFTYFNLLTLLSFILVLLIWFLTFFFIVPIHNKLELNFNTPLNKKLISYNGARTMIWIIKFILLLFLFES